MGYLLDTNALLLILEVSLSVSNFGATAGVVSNLQAAVDSFRADIDMILESRVHESETPSAEHAEDTMMAALFTTSEIPPPPPREHAKRHRGREENEARARKKERREKEDARRASLAEEEAR